MSSSSRKKTDSQPRNDGKVAVRILESIGHVSSKFEKKKQRDFCSVPRQCNAISARDKEWMLFSSKWVPIAFYDSDDQVVRIHRDENPLEVRMEIVRESTKEIISVDAKVPSGVFYYYFKRVDFVLPGKYTIAFTCLNGEELGYDVSPLIIPVEVQPEATSTSTHTPSKKKQLVAPAAPSSATTTRRGAASATPVLSVELNSTTETTTSNTSPPAYLSRARRSAFKVVTDTTVTVPPGSPQVRQRPLSKSHTDDVLQNTPKKKRKTESSMSNLPEEDAVTGSLMTDESVVEPARLDRDYIFKSLVSESESDTFANLSVMLSPVLMTALVDDAHDVHIRASQQKQYQQLHSSKKSKKGVPQDEHLAPPEVFISALPDVGKSTGLSWSVYRILHDPAFEEAMLKNAFPRNKKKLAAQLHVNTNTLLKIFDGLCHMSIDDPSAASSIYGSPLLYHDEVISLQSSGLLHRISHSSDEFMHHHCNARHLLRALVLILLMFPKYSSVKKDQDKSNSCDASDEDLESFCNFSEEILEYLHDHSFPLLYQQ